MKSDQLSSYELVFSFDQFQKLKKWVIKCSIAILIGIIDQYIKVPSILVPLVSWFTYHVVLETILGMNVLQIAHVFVDYS